LTPKKKILQKQWTWKKIPRIWKSAPPPITFLMVRPLCYMYHDGFLIEISLLKHSPVLKNITSRFFTLSRTCKPNRSASSRGNQTWKEVAFLAIISSARDFFACRSRRIASACCLPVWFKSSAESLMEVTGAFSVPVMRSWSYLNLR